MKKVLLFIVLSILLTIAIGCEYQGWQTIFFDNFNRADGDLGSNWTVITSPNASLKISQKQALYTSTSASDNTVICYHDEGIESNKFNISAKVITDSNFANIESTGFIIEPYPGNNKSYSITFNKSWFAIGTDNKETDETTWLTALPVSISVNETYYIELDVDGTAIKGYIKDTKGTIIYEVSAEGEDSSLWSSFFLIMSNGSDTTLKFDDYKIQTYTEQEE